jgi:hypothetical protein
MSVGFNFVFFYVLLLWLLCFQFDYLDHNLLGLILTLRYVDLFVSLVACPRCCLFYSIWSSGQGEEPWVLIGSGGCLLVCYWNLFSIQGISFERPGRECCPRCCLLYSIWSSGQGGEVVAFFIRSRGSCCRSDYIVCIVSFLCFYWFLTSVVEVVTFSYAGLSYRCLRVIWLTVVHCLNHAFHLGFIRFIWWCKSEWSTWYHVFHLGFIRLIWWCKSEWSTWLVIQWAFGRLFLITGARKSLVYAKGRVSVA